MLDITNWEWPQYVYTAIIFFNLFLYAAMDGKPKTGTYSFAIGFVGSLIGFTILLFGGFWA